MDFPVSERSGGQANGQMHTRKASKAVIRAHRASDARKLRPKKTERKRGGEEEMRMEEEQEQEEEMRNLNPKF